MISAKRRHAETRFAAIEKRQQRVLSEHEEAADAVRNKTAKLKAMRLAREAEEAAERAANPTSKKTKKR
jgi:colicin import membrane protein